MKITAERREAGRFTFYTVELATAEGKDPFLTLKDLKIRDGSKRRFVSFRGYTGDKHKWWHSLYASEAFQVGLF